MIWNQPQSVTDITQWYSKVCKNLLPLPYLLYIWFPIFSSIVAQRYTRSNIFMFTPSLTFRIKKQKKMYNSFIFRPTLKFYSTYILLESLSNS